MDGQKLSPVASGPVLWRWWPGEARGQREVVLDGRRARQQGATAGTSAAARVGAVLVVVVLSLLPMGGEGRSSLVLPAAAAGQKKDEGGQGTGHGTPAHQLQQLLEQGGSKGRPPAAQGEGWRPRLRRAGRHAGGGGTASAAAAAAGRGLLPSSTSSSGIWCLALPSWASSCSDHVNMWHHHLHRRPEPPRLLQHEPAAAAGPPVVAVGNFPPYGGRGSLNCSEATQCSECVAVGCLWCPDDSSCLHQEQALEACPNADNQCPNYLYVYIIWLVLSVMLCLCCLTCTTRRCLQEWRMRLGHRSSSLALLGGEAGSHGLYERLLGEQQQEEEALLHAGREHVFRNSLQEAGEEEWLCPVCAFENRPRVRACCLCGTSVEQARTLLHGLMGGASSSSSSSSEAAAAKKKEQHEEGGLGGGLSHSELMVALSARRLNQLTLRQRKARRRRLWQRRRSPDGDGFVWVREEEEGALGLSNGDDKEEEDSSSSSSSQVPPDGGGQSPVQPQARRLAAAAAAPTGQQDDNKDDDEEEALSSPIDRTALSSSPAHVSVMLEEEGRMDWRPVAPLLPTTTTASGSSSLSLGGVQEPSGEAQQQQQQQQQPQQEGGAPAAAAAATAGGVRPPASRVSRRGGEGGGAVEEGEEEDLVAVAALPFRRKHLWFVEKLGRLQLPWSGGHIRLDVSRDRLLEDSFAQVMGLRPSEMREWMRVQFVGEPGVDAGGLEREWFVLVAQALTDPSLGLFTRLPCGAYTISPASLSPACPLAAKAAEALGGWAAARELVLQYYYFAGRVVGKALMEHQTLPVHLSLSLLKHVLGAPLSMADLEFVEPDLHRSLAWLQHHSNVQLLHLDFTVTPPASSASFASHDMRVHELVAGGADRPVTDENKHEYLALRLRYHLLDCMSAQVWQLLKGLYEVVPRELLSVFDYQELELVICGLPVIDVVDWRRHTEYLGHYQRLGERHPVIRWFWEVVAAMTDDERARLLQFTTGACTVPAQGFKALQSNDGNYRQFNIQSVRRSESMFPRAHTCFNKLDVPLYESKEELQGYLSLVISFDLTGFSIE